MQLKLEELSPGKRELVEECLPILLESGWFHVLAKGAVEDILHSVIQDQTDQELMMKVRSGLAIRDFCMNLHSEVEAVIRSMNHSTNSRSEQ